MIRKGCPMTYSMANETIVFIDEGYLSAISKFFGKGRPLKNYIEVFAQNVAREKNLICKQIYFYTAPPYQNPKPTKEENERKARYDLFIAKLKSAKPEITVREGRCQKDEKGQFHQKGVDTLLTMDLLKVAQKKEVSNLLLITSDTDFVPIIKDIRKEHSVKVILGYFTDRRRKSSLSLSNHLWQACDEKILIKKSHFGTV